MAIGTIVLINHTSTNSDVCDDLEQHGMVIAELGSRARTIERVREIKDELNNRRAASRKASATVSHLTIAVDAGEYDFDVIWWRPESLDLDEVEGAVRKVVTEWRAKGKPQRTLTVFDYKKFQGDE